MKLHTLANSKDRARAPSIPASSILGLEANSVSALATFCGTKLPIEQGPHNRLLLMAKYHDAIFGRVLLPRTLLHCAMELVLPKRTV